MAPPLVDPSVPTLIEVLRQRSARQADKTVYRFLANGEEEEASITFAELDRRARALGAFLARHGARGERALLLYPPGLEFVTSFLGCLYAGAIAVPAYPPRTNRPDARLAAIADDARPRFALTTPALAGAGLQDKGPALAAQLPGLQEIQWVATEEIDAAVWAERWEPPDPDPQRTAERIAFLQYTSGSTATPKGVMVTHGNLVHNERMIQLAFGQSEDSVIVGWLPLYHDMGLIGNVLQPLWAGATCVLMAPVAFLQQPIRWLRAISRYRGTTSGGPNFAYELCARKTDPASREGLDLSSWQVAFNGAEPVRAETLHRFAATFAPCGFRSEAFYPCYGLAEATLFVTGGTPGQGADMRLVHAEALARNVVEPTLAGQSSRALVSCGRPWLGQEVSIVDPESGEVLPEGRVGEIRIAGPSVAAGYWNRPDASAEAFGTGAERTLATGDLGFFADGELYVTGRVKDLIIIRGRNHYPQDIELTAERSHPALRPGGGAAFSIDVEGEERLVVVHEVERSQRRELDGVAEAVRRAVAEEHEVPVHTVVLIKPGALPKTSSGKVRRSACRADLLAGRLATLQEWTAAEAAAGDLAEDPRTLTEERLAVIWREVFEGRRFGMTDNFFALGGDSLKATQLVSRINETFGVELPLDSLFTTPTVAAIAEILDGMAGAAGSAVPEAPPLAALQRRPREVPLSFAQRRLWFLHRLDPGNPVHNIAAFLRLTGRLDAAALRAALDNILWRHEALRTVFASAGDEPVQLVVPPAPLPLPVVDLAALPAAVQAAEEERIAADVARLPFSLEHGPFLRAALTVCTSEAHRAESSPPQPPLPSPNPPHPGRGGATTQNAEITSGRGFPLSRRGEGGRWERGPGGEDSSRGISGSYGLVLAWHHIAADGWSLGVFVRELTALYEALVTGRPSPLPGLPVQYADFALWQRQWLRGAALEARLAFWLNRLAGPLPALELPADRPRPAVLSHRGAHYTRAVPSALAGRLGELARGETATPFMALLTGFAALLHRTTGQEDLILGTPISGRNRRELEDLIGVFINNLALRIDAAGDPSFRELLGRVRETALAAYAHQDLPFETLVDALQVGRDLSRTPIFQVLFVEQNVPLRRFELPELALDPHEIDLGTARFDLALAMAPLAAGWLGTWKYSTDLFDAPTPVRMAGHLENLLAAAVEQPDLPLSRLAWLSEEERHQVVLAWNDTAVGYQEKDVCLHQLIEERVERTPQAVAVSFEGRDLTYRQLNERANRLARHLVNHLIRRGAIPESRVGVAAERSLELVVALVATLKAGAAYVPLDPGYPRERLEFMLEDAGISVLLTQSHLEDMVPAGQAERVLLDRFDWEAGPGGNLGAEVLPESPAYAIYTSGSTGRPKGAVIPHRGIVNRLLWMQEVYGLEADDRVLQKTPFSFDVSVWEFFWPLITGARLVVAPPGAHQDAAWLARIIQETGITTLHFVPSMLQLFLDVFSGQGDLAAACRTVRRVMASGEALPYELTERFFERMGTTAGLHNLYGPTEASVDVSFHACERDNQRRSVPIGRPIANIVLHIQDRHGDPVPVGAPGELLIGGIGLARGYLHRPSLTAERFVPHPWGGRGERLYRTGDLARFRPDGAIEFLGRLDHQVKVRGVRIELGEIEAALCRQPGVREAVVLSHQGARIEAETRLVAYLSGPSVPSASELRSALRGSLPEAMVPSLFIVLPSFPLTPSGKVDRKALPAPDFEHSDRERPFVAPRTPLEERIAAMWRDLLRIERVGVHDTFFELGGDSIQGAMFINRLQEEIGQIVYIMALFDAPNVADFAAYLERSYPEAAARLGGRTGAGRPAESAAPADTAVALAALQEAVVRRLGRVPEEGDAPRGVSPVGDAAGRPKNPRAVFILSPFRSGTTLFRVMLAGHPALFAPPELELLAFRTLGERARAYAGRNSFALEGLLRAVMELRGCDVEQAREWVHRCEEENLPTRSFFRLLQEQCGGRLLVDKTPSYPLDLATLRRAEEMFEAPLYLYLTRHPRATIDSYVEAHMDRVYDEFPYGAEEQAELIWLLSHQNIAAFLSEVPAERVHRLRFEDLVKAPRETVEEVCRFLGLPFEDAMLAPYQGQRMTDGPHAASRMMGDPKFHRHQGIDAKVADRWQEARGALRAETLELADRLGYEVAVPAALGPRRVPRLPGVEMALSYSQERLWFLSQLDPVSPAYNMPATIRLQGELDVASLARSFDEVLRRHEVLRTAFPSVAGKPVPEVSPDLARPLPLVDLSGLPEERRRPEMGALSLAEGRRPFDLARGPMLRTTLLRLGAGEHALLVTMHHIASDGWTIGIVIRELAALYRAFALGGQGQPSPLPELPLQYADYAVWQRQWLNEEAMAGHLQYWRSRLSGRLPALDLPTDRPRPAVQTLNGARLSRTLSAAASQRLREWSGRQGTTPFLILLAGFNALLHRYTTQDDLLLGIPIANRNRLETEGLVGFFLNMVVQRTDASGDPALRALLGRVSEGFLGSVPHQEVPFEKVVEAVQPERDLSRAPIFQVQFSLQNTPNEPLVLPGLTLELLEIHNRTTKFDFTVFLFDLPEGLKTTLEYNTDLFDESTIARLLGHWETLLAGAPEAADLRLSDLPLLTAPEREQLLVAWNRPGAAFISEPCLHRRFEEQARLHPKSVAVVYELEELTYEKLNARANRLARRLRALGVGPEVAVGLCVERSVDTIVGLLGILKAGGAYVPLDPAYPRERLSYSLDDALSGSRAPVLVTQAHLAGLFGDGRPFTVVRLDADRQLLAAESPENLSDTGEDGAAPENLAYVIYTSGSTGRPKGVQVTHADAVRLLTATEPWFGFGAGDVWTLFHSYAFDFSVWEIWGALAHGGRLVVVPREATLSPAAFYELLVTEGVTVLNQTPSAFRQLVQHEETEPVRKLSLRRVIFGGEALELSALAPWFACHGDETPRLINMYGITETTVHVTYRPIRAEDLKSPGNAPIGEPIPDLSVHLLGRRGELVPVGVPGEIHVGGAGVARGYLGRPALTAERFVPDPFSGIPGSRLYRSGDLARRRPDGDLEYLGRIDHQVKIRGFRIELGEIEAALLTHPEVHEAVVMARQDVSGDRRLVAYVTARGAAPAVHDLRSHLRDSLPEYMVPAALVHLERMPLTPSGKIDRRALPDPEEAHSETDVFVGPRTRTERRLADAWREILRVERVAVDDNFFDLGGHSLLVTQLASRIRAELGVELPMASVFEAPTLAALAGRIDALLPEDAERELAGPAIVAVPRDRLLPLSFSQERLWFLDQFQPGSPLYNVPISLRLRGRLDAAALERTFREIVRRHEVLRTGFTSIDGQPVQMAEAEVRLEIPVSDVSDSPLQWSEARLAELAEEEAQRPFDLAKPPLLRVRLVRLAKDDHALLATIHHIVSDGWSMGVLIREVVSLYTAFSQGGPSPLPELPIQYADYAVWQRGWLQGEVLEGELAFWREQLAGAPQALDLPADRTRPPVHGSAGRHLRFTLPKGLVMQLQSLARQEGATLFMALLAAFEMQIHRYTRRTDFLIGSPVANRRHRELEDLIGFFVNTLVLRARVPGDLSLPELLALVKETTLAAFGRQDLPFEKLVQSTEVARDTSRSPLFQVLFVLQNAPAQTLALPDLTLEVLEPESGTAKFDLTLSMMETAEGLHGFLEYSTDLFDEATAARMLGHFRNLLGELATDHRRRISELSMLGHAERQELLAAWNDTRTEIAELPFHRLFELQARISPEAPAVAGNGTVLTYDELSRQANQLARHLRGLGVGPETRVGIALERSPSLLSALLGTLKSGGAYVPLDPSHPRERLAMILEDAHPAVLLTGEGLCGELPVPDSCRVVCLDGAWDEGGLLAAESGEPFAESVEAPESLAYVIFTSGSTGRPKGVQIPHGALVNFLLSMQREPGLGAADVLVAVTTVSFDIAALELFLPLLVGARIELASREEVSDGVRLAERIASSKATALQATPAGWRMLLDAGWKGDPTFKALCGGEALTPDLAERLLPRVGSLWNVYGPTETTIWSAAGRVESVGASVAAPMGSIPIGPAIANTTLYVLDPYFEPAAVGVMGDLFIGGAGLSRGYLGSPEMTAERFVPDPFAGKGAPGARLYRTGDLARRRADGRIDFLGRADHQVKIRGYRIEPDEIAAVLAKHPGARETVVVARPSAIGDPRLVAYLIPAIPAPSVDDLRGFLRDKLPAYMLPADFVLMESFPLNPSGKVDRRALPAPEGTSAVGRELALPETPTEETLAAIWEQVLGRAGIGIHDNFFELGGHSLLAPQIVSRVEQTFQIRLPLRTFFESPTLSATALNIDLLLLEEIEALSEEEAAELGVEVG